MSISPHSLSLFRTCPYKFKLASIEGLPPQYKLKSEELETGILVHRIIVEYYKKLSERNYSFTETDIRLTISELMANYNIQEGSTQHTSLMNFIKFETSRISHFGLGKIVYLESRLEKEIEYRGVKLILKGIIDVGFNFGGKVVLFDWKTGWKAIGVNMNYNIQSAIYKKLTECDAFYFIYLTHGKAVESKANFDTDVLPLIDDIVGEKEFKRVRGAHCEDCEYNIPCFIRERKIYV